MWCLPSGEFAILQGPKFDCFYVPLALCRPLAAIYESNTRSSMTSRYILRQALPHSLLHHATSRCGNCFEIFYKFFKSFDTDTYRTRTHPVFLTPFEEMAPVQKVNDDEFRALAVSFLEDIERSRNVMSEENIRDLVRDFGFFKAKGDNNEDSLHHSMKTEYCVIDSWSCVL
jgi:hypothetical protein